MRAARVTRAWVTRGGRGGSFKEDDPSSLPSSDTFAGRSAHAHHVFPVKGVPDPLNGKVTSVVAVSLGDDFSSTGVRFRTDN